MTYCYTDLETFSSVDLKSQGLYKYIASPDFEVLMVSYAFDDEPVKTVDLLSGELWPEEFIDAYFNDEVIMHAHNAVFERLALAKVIAPIPIARWECSLVKCAYAGIQLSLDKASKMLGLSQTKLASTGADCIKYFSIPCKPTKVNGRRTRNYPEHNPEKWADYLKYNAQDVETERAIAKRLEDIILPEREKQLYILDQEINDRGIMVDLDFVNKAAELNGEYKQNLVQSTKDDLGIEKPNSVAQIKRWCAGQGYPVDSVTKDDVARILADPAAPPQVKALMESRSQLRKSSIKKYTAILNMVGEDCRVRGLFQFYGANRTGRWAGRGVQLHNLPQNHIALLDEARELVLSDCSLADKALNIELVFGNVSDTLSQLIRTALIAGEGRCFAVADFSAIEARVIAWLADEHWRQEVFKTHGKIYEASASMMFKIPIESIKKDSDVRQKGKIAELALGFGGSLGALERMGGASMGLNQQEMRDIVKRWRIANPNIVELWNTCDEAAIEAILHNCAIHLKHGIVFDKEDDWLTIKLPSGRKLYYFKPKLGPSKMGATHSILYHDYSLGMVDTETGLPKLETVDTYGGKLVENIVQATARDCLGEAMLRVNAAGYPIELHVHDEMGVNIPVDGTENNVLRKLYDIMGQPISWAPGLLLNADGYVTRYYKKD